MAKDLGRAMCDATIWGEKRSPKHESDFGDDATVGLKLKATGKTFDQFGDHDFGVFLGKQEDGLWYVGTCRVIEFAPSKIRFYKTLDELKRNWILD